VNCSLNCGLDGGQNSSARCGLRCPPRCSPRSYPRSSDRCGLDCLDDCGLNRGPRCPPGCSERCLLRCPTDCGPDCLLDCLLSCSPDCGCCCSYCPALVSPSPRLQSRRFIRPVPAQVRFADRRAACSCGVPGTSDSGTSRGCSRSTPAYWASEGHFLRAAASDSPRKRPCSLSSRVGCGRGHAAGLRPRGKVRPSASPRPRLSHQEHQAGRGNEGPRDRVPGESAQSADLLAGDQCTLVSIRGCLFRSVRPGAESRGGRAGLTRRTALLSCARERV